MRYQDLYPHLMLDITDIHILTNLDSKVHRARYLFRRFKGTDVELTVAECVDVVNRFDIEKVRKEMEKLSWHNPKPTSA
jgi:hypothetical protein